MPLNERKNKMKQVKYSYRSKWVEEKSPVIAATLGLFFGAFGLFYVRWWVGLAWIFPFLLIMTVVTNIFNSPAGLGIGILVALIVSSVFGYFVTKGINSHYEAKADSFWH